MHLSECVRLGAGIVWVLGLGGWVTWILTGRRRGNRGNRVNRAARAAAVRELVGRMVMGGSVRAAR